VRISVLTPVHDPPADVLAECLESVASQTWRDREHVLVDDASSAPHVGPMLEAAAARDPRVTVIRSETNLGIAGASQLALDAARGEVVALLDHDDVLVPTALARMAEAFEDPLVDYAYSDEDVLAPNGALVEPFFKPDWSPERFRNQMYTCHLSAIRTELAREVGGFRSGFDGSQDWDLVLRVTERARRIVHVPEVLYHWRVIPTSVLAGTEVKPYAYESARKALEEHAARVGIDAEVVELANRGYFHLVRRHREHPLVSIVVPTRGSEGRVRGLRRCMVVEAVRSIVERSTWPNWELVLVADDDTPASALDEVAELAGERLRVVPFPGPFNFSAKCNAGVAAATGDLLVFLNDDVEVIDGNWLEVLVGFAREPDVGASGLLLLFEDGRVQHAGHVHLAGNPGHLMFGQLPDSPKNRSALALDREVAGLTAACLCIRREVFDEVGGFDEAFASNYNDVDLSLRLRSRGYRLVVSPQARLHHFESMTRDPTVGEHETEALRRRWGDRLLGDPYYNPNHGTAYDNFPVPLEYV
jgi:GT2 family glycosyltransferase